ncbi:MAG: DUF433 domain-containing protein [Ignavibacteriae bacterium]|nr:DUF433 domain-containing protein [Ignavibacteriota bacterium]
METITSYRYIVRKTETQEPVIRGTRISVRDVVEQWKMGMSPDEIPSVYPHITLAQVFEALAYYQDNKEEIESFIGKNKIPESLSGKALSR